jgi:hypothetical protein
LNHPARADRVQPGLTDKAAGLKACRFIYRMIILAFIFCKTIAAINRPAVPGLKGDLGFFAAGRTGRVEHLALAAGIRNAQPLFFSCSARLAPLGVVGEAFFGVELLLGGRKCEIGLAVYACEGSVLVAQG